MPAAAPPCLRRPPPPPKPPHTHTTSPSLFLPPHTRTHTDHHDFAPSGVLEDLQGLGVITEPAGRLPPLVTYITAQFAAMDAAGRAKFEAEQNARIHSIITHNISQEFVSPPPPQAAVKTPSESTGVTASTAPAKIA